MQVPSGSKDVAVNDVIAFTAEEGDDLSELPDVSKPDSPAPEKPKEDSPKSDAPPPPRSQGHAHFDKPAFPSVMRLANAYGIEEPEKDIKATGPHGMLTKGDVLAYLKKSRSAYGTSKAHHTTISELGQGAAPSKKAQKSKDSPSLPPKVRMRN